MDYPSFNTSGNPKFESKEVVWHLAEKLFKMKQFFFKMKTIAVIFDVNRSMTQRSLQLRH